MWDIVAKKYNLAKILRQIVRMSQTYNYFYEKFA